MLLELCCFSKLKRVWIRDFSLSVKLGLSLRENDQVLLMSASRRIESNVTASDMPVLCDS